MKLFRKYIFYITVFSGLISFAQKGKIDSLSNLLKKDKEDTGKVVHLYKLSIAYLNEGITDSALYYGNCSLELAEKINFRKGIAGACGNLGSAYMAMDNYSMALDHYQKALSIDEETRDSQAIAKRLVNVGSVY